MMPSLRVACTAGFAAVFAALLPAATRAQGVDSDSSSFDGPPPMVAGCKGYVNWTGIPKDNAMAVHTALEVTARWTLKGCPAGLEEERRFAVFGADEEIVKEQRGHKLYLPPRALRPGSYHIGTELLLLFPNGTVAHELRADTDLDVGAARCTALTVTLPAQQQVANDQRRFVVRPTVNTSACPNVPFEVVFVVMDPTTQEVVASPSGRFMEIDATQFSAGESFLITASVFAFGDTATVEATSSVMTVTFTQGSGSGAGAGGDACDDYLEIDGVPDEIRHRGDRPLRIAASLRSGCPLPRNARIQPTWRMMNGSSVLAEIKRMNFVVPAGELPAGSYTLTLAVLVSDGTRSTTLDREVGIEITDEPAQLRILGGNRTVGTSGVLDFVADGVGMTGDDVVWGLCEPDLTRSGLKCGAAVQVEGISGERGWAVFVDAPSEAGSWVLWATAKGVRAAIMVRVVTGPVLDTSIFGVPLRPVAGGAPMTLFAYAEGATSYSWHIASVNGGAALSGRTGEELSLTAAEVDAAAAAATGGKVQVRVVARNAAGTTGEAAGTFKVVKAKQGRCSASGARGFGKITGGTTAMTLKATDFAETGVEVLYAFGYELGHGDRARDVILGDDFGTAASFNFTAPVLAGRGNASVKVTFFVEAIPADALDDPHVTPVIARCHALVHRNEKLSGNVTAFAELADAELDLAEEAGDLGQMLRAMAGVTAMFGEYTLPGGSGNGGAADVARAGTMRKNSLGSLRRTFTKGGGKMTSKQREQVLSTMAGLFGDDEDADDDLVDDVSGLLDGVLGDFEGGGLDMEKLGAQVVKMLLKVPDSAEGNTSRRALSQKAALATATGLRVGQEREVKSGGMTLRATKLPVDAMTKKSVAAGSKMVKMPRRAFGPANLSKATEVAVSTVDYATVPMPNATGASKIKNGSAVELDIVVSNKKRAVAGLNATDAVKINVTVAGAQAGAQAGTARCAFFDAAIGNWSTAGVTTEVAAGGVVQCRSTHLSLFAVQDTTQTAATPQPTTPPTPSGSSVAALGAAGAAAVAAVLAAL